MCVTSVGDSEDASIDDLLKLIEDGPGARPGAEGAELRLAFDCTHSCSKDATSSSWPYY